MHGALASLHPRQDLPTRNPNQSCYLDPTRRSSLSSSIHQDIWHSTEWERSPAWHYTIINQQQSTTGLRTCGQSVKELKIQNWMRFQLHISFTMPHDVWWNKPESKFIQVLPFQFDAITLQNLLPSFPLKSKGNSEMFLNALEILKMYR